MRSLLAPPIIAVALAVALAACTAPASPLPGTDEPVPPGSGEMTDVLIFQEDLGLVPDATAQESNEPLSSTVDEYLERRAVGLPPIEPVECAEVPVDLVLIGRDAGAAGAIFVPPSIEVDGAIVQQTGRQFASADDATAFFDEYRAALTACAAFTVTAVGGEIVVEQTVADADLGDLRGFRVDLDIASPQGETKNTQYVFVSDALAVMLSSAAAESDEQRLAALETVVDVVTDRLTAATAG